MKFILSLFVCSILFLQVDAQRVIRTDEGDKYLLYDNGNYKKIVDGDPHVAEQARSDCDFEINRIDPFTNEEWVVMSYDSLVSFTPDSLSEQYSYDNYITILSHLAYITDNEGLFLSLIVQDTTVAMSLDNENMISFIFAEGAPIEVEIDSDIERKVNFDKEFTRISVRLDLTDQQSEIIANHDLQKIGIQWEGNYQEYPTSNPDLFREQAYCVNMALEEVQSSRR